LIVEDGSHEQKTDSDKVRSRFDEISFSKKTYCAK
jgi:hypothetical protein